MYTDKLALETYLKRELTESEEAYLDILAPAIKTWIDKATDSNYSKVDPTTRYFDGGECSVDIDPCTDITNVSSLNSFDRSVNYEYLANDHIFEPVNERVKREIRQYGHFPSGEANIAVTARFSEWDGGVPDDIRHIATMIAAGVLTHASKLTGGELESESIEGHSYKLRDSSSSVEKVAMDSPGVMAVIKQRREILLG